MYVSEVFLRGCNGERNLFGMVVVCCKLVFCVGEGYSGVC